MVGMPQGVAAAAAAAASGRRVDLHPHNTLKVVNSYICGRVRGVCLLPK